MYRNSQSKSKADINTREYWRDISIEGVWFAVDGGNYAELDKLDNQYQCEDTHRGLEIVLGNNPEVQYGRRATNRYGDAVKWGD